MRFHSVVCVLGGGKAEEFRLGGRLCSENFFNSRRAKVPGS